MFCVGGSLQSKLVVEFALAQISKFFSKELLLFFLVFKSYIFLAKIILFQIVMISICFFQRTQKTEIVIYLTFLNSFVLKSHPFQLLLRITVFNLKRKVNTFRKRMWKLQQTQCLNIGQVSERKLCNGVSKMRLALQLENMVS